MNVLIGCECTGTIRDAFIAAGHNAYSCDILPDRNGKKCLHLQDDILNVLNSETYMLPNGYMATRDYWDLFIVHPDCTYLTCSAEWCYKDIELQTKKLDPSKLYGVERRAAREVALQFVRDVMKASEHIPKFVMENPTGKINTVIKKPDQYIHPYQYGHDASKRTGLWLRGLPKLVADPVNSIKPRMVCSNCGTEHAPEYFENKLKKACLACVVNGKDPTKLLPRWANQTNSGQNRLPPSKDRWLLRAATYQGWADAMAAQWGDL